MSRVNQIKDLGVTFSFNMCFSHHIEGIVSKAFMMLGFLMRNSKVFKDPYTLKSLYISLVRSHLEYASIVWAPHYFIYRNNIERVQKRFIKFCLRSLNFSADNLSSYDDKCKLIDLESLDNRRFLASVTFAFDVLSSHITCPRLLELFGLKIHRPGLRSDTIFNVPFHRSNYGFYEPISNCMRNNNICSELLDFHFSRKVFKQNIKHYLLNKNYLF